MRYHQLQSRLATLKIENEEVRGFVCLILKRAEIASVSISFENEANSQQMCYSEICPSLPRREQMAKHTDL